MPYTTKENCEVKIIGPNHGDAHLHGTSAGAPKLPSKEGEYILCEIAVLWNSEKRNGERQREYPSPMLQCDGRCGVGYWQCF
jgi:hypothetical protein